MEKETAKIIADAFGKFFHEVIVPYITTCDLNSQKIVLELVKQTIQKSNSKEEAIKMLNDFEECYQQEIDKSNGK